jgi:hypothetical protein
LQQGSGIQQGCGAQLADETAQAVLSLAANPHG